MKNTPLSTTMQAALAYADKHGGVLKRAPGGFWNYNAATPRGLLGREAENPYVAFSTQTVQALVYRGFLKWCEWSRVSGGFPIAACTVTRETLSEAIDNIV